MSAVETGQMFSVEIGQMFAVETSLSGKLVQVWFGGVKWTSSGQGAETVGPLGQRMVRHTSSERLGRVLGHRSQSGKLPEFADEAFLM